MARIVVMDFYADWCAPCRVQKPIIEELEKEFKKKVEFKKMDIDNKKREAAEHQVTSIPTIIIKKDGKVVEKLIGLQTKENLKKVIEGLL